MEGRYWKEAVNGGAVLGGRQLTEGRYWKEAVNEGAVLGGTTL